ERIELDLAQAQPAAPQARELEQVLDQLAQAAAAGVDPRQQVARLLGELVGEVLEQDLREPVDRAQRSAQVVRDRRAERLEVAVAGLERVGALEDAALEVGVELAQRCLGLRALDE